MSAETRDRRRREGGQALVVMVAALIPALLMVAVIVDGGNAWTQQRITQNAADSAADAGATVLAQRSVGSSSCTSDVCWDGRVRDAATIAGLDKGVTIEFCGAVGAECTYYTDFTGTQALGPVGAGSIPANTAGVRAFGKRQFGTYFAQIAGITSFTAAGDAIARYGFSGCPSSGADPQVTVTCAPLAFYVNWVGCDKSGKAVVQEPATEVASYLGQFIALPICKTTGNWGWLNPDDIAGKTIPDWFDSSTGRREDVNHIQYLSSIASMSDPPTILLPIYDCANTTATCPDPSDSSNSTRLSDMFNCNGTNCYYHIVVLGAFQLYAVYSNNPGICGGQFSTDCLYGKFTAFITDGSLLQAAPGYIPGNTHGKGGTRGVQLIK